MNTDPIQKFDTIVYGPPGRPLRELAALYANNNDKDFTLAERHRISRVLPDAAFWRELRATSPEGLAEAKAAAKADAEREAAQKAANDARRAELAEQERLRPPPEDNALNWSREQVRDWSARR